MVKAVYMMEKGKDKKAVNRICAKIEEITDFPLKKGESQLDYIERCCNKVQKRLQDQEEENRINEQRVNEFLEVLVSLARQDFSKRAVVSDKGDYMDALAAGINMMGEELRASTVSLKEKEVLLKEIHHRVKNNLQIISSLLNLQAGYVEDKELLHKFKDSRNRINSMALVHENLYETGNLARVNIRKYIISLVDSLKRSYEADNITTHVDIPSSDVFFKIDFVVHCGLIISELLTNAYKYAFPDKEKGDVYVRFSELDETENWKYQLVVEDNGIGISAETLQGKSPKTLGLELVELLTDQLDGKFDIKSDKGTAITVLF